jgi:hypothetical protein
MRISLSYGRSGNVKGKPDAEIRESRKNLPALFVIGGNGYSMVDKLMDEMKNSL